MTLRVEAARFNPRAREGRDNDQSADSPEQTAFQSTRPRGARRSARRGSACRAGFNPRAREGRDNRRAAVAGIRNGFNPRAREGRDLVKRIVVVIGVLFQSTRPRGARPRSDVVAVQRGVSIHAPARGATKRPDLPIEP